MKTLLACLIPLLLAACAVTYNDGNTVSIRHMQGVSMETVQEQAQAACEENGKKQAVLVATHSMAPNAPKFLLPDEISTFKCQ